MSGYASYTYQHPSLLVRYPHGVRMRILCEHIAAVAPASWLDFGAGDGALIAELWRRGRLPGRVVAFEPDEGMRQELQANLAIAGVPPEQVRVAERLEDIGSEAFTLITALEVLEHLTLPLREGFYRYLDGGLERDGHVVIEVPVEYGPILLAKELGRRFLKGRRSQYAAAELALAALFGRVRDTQGRYDPENRATFISPHQGFSLPRLEEELRAHGQCGEMFRSPFPKLPRWCNQTVGLIFRPAAGKPR